MAQLPPKVPPMTQNWPSFPCQTMPSAAAAQPPSWFDEFLDFSSVRRSTHRRSASDSIAFIPVEEECRNSNSHAGLMNGNNGFEGLDDDQLMTMFSDDAAMAAPPTVSSSNPSTDPSTTSDQNSNDDEKPTPADHHHHPPQQPKNEAGEVDSSCKSDADKSAPPSSAPTSGDSVVDPKRVKR